MTLVILLQLKRWRKQWLKMSRRKRDASKKEDRWTLMTATFVQVQRPAPSFPKVTVGEVSAVHACLNRNAAECHR